MNRDLTSETDEAGNLDAGIRISAGRLELGFDRGQQRLFMRSSGRFFPGGGWKLQLETRKDPRGTCYTRTAYETTCLTPGATLRPVLGFMVEIDMVSLPSPLAILKAGRRCQQWHAQSNLVIARVALHCSAHAGCSRSCSMLGQVCVANNIRPIVLPPAKWLACDAPPANVRA